MTQLDYPPVFDPGSARFLADRYAAYRSVRDEAPLLALGSEPPTILLSRYADVERALRDSSVRMLPPGAGAPAWLGDGPAAQMFLGQMLFTDPPDHTRLRQVTSPAFRPRNVSALRDAVDRAVVERIEVLREKNTFDAVAEFAEFVPAVAVCTILGIPETDWPTLIRGAVDFVFVLSPLPLTAGQLSRANRVSRYYLDYFHDLIEDRRRHPRGEDDFLTALVTAQGATGKLSELEVLVTAHSVLNAGFETTMSALANGLQGMLGEPGQTMVTQWADLAAEPDLIPAAVEEALRWEAPAQLLTRFASEDLALDSGAVPAGTALVLAVAAANHDERRFDRPESFDLHRPDRAHLSFGLGRHACIGAHLGRMELDIAFRNLAAAFPGMQLAGSEAVREGNAMFPTLRRLDVVGRP